MKIYNIATKLGPATLASIEHPIHPIDTSPSCGLILWGRCDRTTLLTIALGSNAEWIAYYDIKSKEAIAVFPPDLVGERFQVDTTSVDVSCPKCGSTRYVGNGAKLWRCSDCGRQWNRSGAKRKLNHLVQAGNAF